eukprot:SAG31_NODE_22462_length_525_cov_0.638498_2_plen_60_part_01
MRTLVLAVLLAVLGVGISIADAERLEGSFFSGEGDTGFLRLLDTARLQWSSTGVDFQSVN